MARFGFVGPSYQSQSPTADAEECINLYVENMEADGKSANMLYNTPGLSLFGAIATPVRGIFFIQYQGGPSAGRCFAVGGSNLYEVFSDGSSAILGNVGSDSLPVTFAAIPEEIAVASAGNLFVYTLTAIVLPSPMPAGTFVAVPSTSFINGPVARVDNGDGFFIVFSKNSDTWQVSNPDDGITWNPLSVEEISVFPENITSMMVDHRYVWIFGQKKSVVYADAGAPIFPYEVIPGALLELGCIARDSVAKADNSIFWLGADERGAGMVWRSNGFSGVRVSTFAMEQQIQRYPMLSDAIGYSYQEAGHTFYVLRFPSANVTWVYDAATGLWHKRGFWNGSYYVCHLSQCHAYAFGKHLVGDWSTGNIYSQSISNLTDNGNPIVRTRIAPTISNESTWMTFQQLQIDVESGLGPMPPLLDGRGNPRDPQMLVSWSDDNAHTWSNEHAVNCGRAGGYKLRAIIRRLGRSRNRTFKVTMSDAIPWRITDAYLTATGFEPSERLTKRLGKVA